MMSEEQYAVIRDRIAGYLGGCPDVVIRTTIDDQTVEWCRQTHCLLARHGGKVKGGGKIPQGVWAPNSGRVVAIKKVFDKHGQLPLQAWTTTFLQHGASFAFRHYVNEGDAYLVEFAWEPTRETDELPEDWFEEYHKTIGDMTLMTLLAQEGTPWAKPALARQFMDAYRSAFVDTSYKMRAAGEPGGQLNCFARDNTFAGAVF